MGGERARDSLQELFPHLLQSCGRGGTACILPAGTEETLCYREQGKALRGATGTGDGLLKPRFEAAFSCVKTAYSWSMSTLLPSAEPTRFRLREETDVWMTLFPRLLKVADWKRGTQRVNSRRSVETADMRPFVICALLLLKVSICSLLLH